LFLYALAFADLKLKGTDPRLVKIGIFASKLKLSVKPNYFNFEHKIFLATIIDKTEVKVKVKDACQLTPVFVLFLEVL
jgi:hypothetical protein